MSETPTKDLPPIDENTLAEKAEADPKSRKWNNPNSRRNLRQYRSESSDPLVPEILNGSEDVDPDGDDQASKIVSGRKITADLVKKLMPKRSAFTAAERERWTGIVMQYLSDFKNEEPTTSDLDDIFEIAKADILEMRLLEASKSPENIIVANQSLDKIYKRKQQAKENLSARRSDRLSGGLGLDISIIDLVASYDQDQRKRYDSLMDEKLKKQGLVREKMLDIIRKDG